MSGGQTAFRGFLIQTITCILKSLKENKEKRWDNVEIEPKSNEEKIDLKWYKKDKLIIACQVKSSINAFTIDKTISLLSEMVRLCPEAQNIELVLVGNFENGIIEISRKINGESKLSSSDQKRLINLMQHINQKRIRIEIHNFERSVTNKTPIFVLMKDEIHEYLPSEIELTHNNLESLSLALIGKFAMFSTSGSKISINNLDRIIRNMIQEKLEEISTQSYLARITVKSEDFGYELEKAMAHTVVKQWFNKNFQIMLKFLVTEIAFNAFDYGGATECDFQIYHDKIVLIDNGANFDLSKDTHEIVSNGHKLGTQTYNLFFRKYGYVSRYNHQYDEESKKNIVTINVIQDFNLFVEKDCEIITKGTFPPANRSSFKSISLDIPPYCDSFVFYSNNLFGTGETMLIDLILSKIPDDATLIVKHRNTYPVLDMLKEVFVNQDRLKFEPYE